LKRAGVLAEYRTARTKPEMAPEIDRAIAAGVRFGCGVPPTLLTLADEVIE
jgi:hypothetical protein